MQIPLLPRELTPESVLFALQGRRGAANGATARDLVFIITGKVSGAEERRLRQIIEKLRCDGHPICAHPALGYHFAATASELEATCMFLTRRMVTTGRQVAAMNRVAMPDFYGQLGLPQPTDDDEETDQ